MNGLPRHQSLYRQFGVPASDGGPGPGTIETKQIETLDAWIGGPPPGTIQTARVETMDNDIAGLGVIIWGAGPVRPGTGVTATIETMDTEAVGEPGTLM